MSTSRQRVATALARGIPDHVPYCEESINRSFGARLMGWPEPNDLGEDLEDNPFSIDEAKAIAAALQMDNISYVLRAPVYAEKHAGQDGTLFYGEGLIRTAADLAKVQLPDPDDDALYAEAARFASEKGDFSAWFNSRIGIFSTMLSMGLEAFCIALWDDRSLIEQLLDTYVDWTVAVASRVGALGFDAFISTDDLAFNTAPFFSPQVFHDLVLPRYQRVAKSLTVPWIMHSDGNVLPFLDDVVSAGIVAVHPLEKGAVDIRQVKREYGDRLCLLGNVDMNLLAIGTREEVVLETRRLIEDVAPGGGYIVTSGNSLAGYCRVENVRAMSETVQRWGSYPSPS
jgi:uroporphyrinogen decarboxylase